MSSSRSTFLSRSPLLQMGLLTLLLAAAAVTTSTLGHAQDLEGDLGAASAADTSDEPAAEPAATDGAEQPEREVISSPPDSKGRGSGIWEDPKETYLFAGLRYRMQVVPQSVQNWFAQGGETLWVNTPGVEFGIRQDGFEYNIFGMLGMYSMTNVPFKGKTDVELAWETITADYNVLFLGSDFMWSTSDFSPGLSMIYGAGIGLGIVFGEMTRTQAYPDGNGSYVPCVGMFNPNVPGPGGVYCDNVNDHYNGKVEPNWANGGSSPLVFPWIAGQLGLRYKAHRNFVGRLELGFTVTSLFFGLGADYGI